MAALDREEISKEGLGLDDDFQSDDGNDWEAEQEWGDEDSKSSPLNNLVDPDC